MIKTLSLMVLAAMASHASAGLYSLEVLPNHPTDQFTVMSSINDAGVVVGESYTGQFTQGPKRILSYTSARGLETVIENLSQDGLQFLPRVNNAGQIAYTHNLRPGIFSDLIRSYRYTPGLGSEELAAPNPLLSYVATNMNNGGDIVAQSLSPDGWLQNSVIYRAGSGPEVLSSSFYASSIANDGTLVGVTPSLGFVWRPGRNPEFISSISVSRMNDAGQVLGSSGSNGMLWAPDLRSFQAIPISGGRLLNDGTVVGGVRPNSLPLQSLGRWTPEGGFEEITQMLDSEALAYGFDRWGVRDVNQRGEILASAWVHDPNNQFFEPRFNIILRPSPVPEPGTMLALGAGLAALLRRRRGSNNRTECEVHCIARTNESTTIN